MNRTNYTILKQIRNSYWTKGLAGMTCASLLWTLCAPNLAYGLTSGPGQAEFTGFAAASTTEVVDLYSGNFGYNIPVISVPGPNGGYPINLSYSSSVGMEDEASWVGLGWSLNVGAINRQLRGLPDDFDGDVVTDIYNLMPDQTSVLDLPPAGEWIGNGTMHSEMFGLPFTPPGNSLWSGQLYYNNYRGLGSRVVYSNSTKNEGLNAGIGLTYDSQSGLTVSPSMTVQSSVGSHLNLGLSGSGSIAARSGVALSVGVIVGIKQDNARTLIGDNGRQGAVETTGGVRGTSSISFNGQQGIPRVQVPMETNTKAFNYRIGRSKKTIVLTGGLFGAFASAFLSAMENSTTMSGSVSESKVANGGVVVSPAYGYMNTEAANASDGDLMDYTAADYNYSDAMPNIPLGNYTHDLFTVTGQGMGGMFRAHRTTVDVVSEAKVTSTTKSSTLTLEFGTELEDPLPAPQLNVPPTFNLFHLGAGYSTTNGTNSTSDWDDGVSNMASFETTGYSYFKFAGEQTGKSLGDDVLRNKWGGDDPLRVQLGTTGNWLNEDFEAEDHFVKSEYTAGTQYPTGGMNATMHPGQYDRGRVIQARTGPQAAAYGLSKTVEYKIPDTQNPGEYVEVAKSFNGNGDISEYVVTQGDGMRYCYGIAAYNTEQIDVSSSFDNSSGTYDHADRIVPLTAGMHNGSYDQFFHSTELPGYVHSWLLTTIVSDDYVDRTGDGPSQDDFGYWVKFNYKKQVDDYQWRNPYQGCNFVEGNKNDYRDDRGFYSFGKKDIYYVESIETKTHIAYLTTSEREDAIEANGALFNQGDALAATAAKKMHKLEEVNLYVKGDTEQETLSSTPISTVHFVYDYSQCKGVPNNTGIDHYADINGDGVATEVNDGGKLTLRRLYFTQQNTTRGELSPYVFGYGDQQSLADNPDYHPEDMDRWGAYQANSRMYTNGEYENAAFPYTLQSDRSINPNAPYADIPAPWTLKTIELPTGGTMTIEYEKDDYAYVEDQHAMQMYDVLRVGETGYSASTLQIGSAYEYTRDDVSYTSPTADLTSKYTLAGEDYYRMYIILDQEIPQTNQDEIFREKYLKNMDYMYYKAKVNLSSAMPQFVEGFMPVSQVLGTYGVLDLNNTNGTNESDMVGYFSVPAVKLSLLVGQTHPIRRAALDILHLDRRDITSNIVAPNGNGGSQFIGFVTQIFGAIQDVMATLVGFKLWAAGLGYADDIDLRGHTVVRLYNPSGSKVGGGSRVKKVTVNDNWANSSAATDNSVYGQKYTYTTIEDGVEISSGVAYEPGIGSFESALKQPVLYEKSSLLHANLKLFQTEPLMEAYYPGASVGYRKVLVESIAPDRAFEDNNSIESSAAPVALHEFYSPKEFPVICKPQTDAKADPKMIRPIVVPGFSSILKVRKARSQGYSIVLNDMAGKQKAVSSYPRKGYNPLVEPPVPLAQSKYFYRTKGAYNEFGSNELENKVQVLKKGDYVTEVLGETVDIFIERNESQESSQGWGIEANLELGLSATTFPYLIFAPTVFPQYNKNETSFKTILTNKMIHRSGILERVETTTSQSKLVTENLAYDHYSGAPVLTRAVDEHNQSLYSAATLAQWYYEGTGAATQNTDVFLTNNTIAASGWLTIASGNVASRFTPGDELYVTGTGYAEYLTVTQVDIFGNGIVVVDEDGAYAAPGFPLSLVIYRSGHRNLLNASIGGVTVAGIDGFSDAETLTQVAFTIDATKVLHASAIEMADFWQTSCPEDGCPTALSDHVNPYRTGIKGNWRPVRSYAYNTSRAYAGNIVEDGYYADFSQFLWDNPGNSDPAWTNATTVTKYSPYGFELEERDALGIYSAVQFGYENSLAVAIGGNMSYNQIAFDGFEDYPKSCESDHFSFDGTPVDNVAHTGQYSLRVLPQSNASVTFETDNSRELCNIKYSLGGTTGDFNLDDCHCVGDFGASFGETYIMSGWAKVGTSATLAEYTYTDIEVQVNFYDLSGNPVGVPFVIITSGEIIEGWQRFEGEVPFPSMARSSEILLINNNTTEAAYFDDFRAFPKDGNMVSYVYDPVTLKLSAELDVNNYATIYVYDDAGNLTIVKKETVEGIQTLQEGRVTPQRESYH